VSTRQALFERLTPSRRITAANRYFSTVIAASTRSRSRRRSSPRSTRPRRTSRRALAGRCPRS